MPTNKNAFFFKINQIKFANITNQDVMTCISLGKGINGDKNIASDEELHVEFLKQLNKHQPSSDTILVGGLLARWNFWEMMREISDDELARRLEDIPKNVDEKKLSLLLAEKFSDIAVSLEEKYIQKLMHHLQENKEAQGLSFPFKVMPWNQRENFTNFTKQPANENKIPESNESETFINDTIKQFLQDKQTRLDTAKKRLTKVLPEIANLNFDKLVKHSCEAFILEEYEYFSRLRDTQLFYNGHIPALNPILRDHNNNVYWHNYNFKQRKNLQKEFKTTTSFIEEQLCLSESKPTENPLTLFTNNSPELKEPTTLFINTGVLSPTSRNRLQKFFESYLNNQSPTTKELADRKIEEASRLLSIN